MDAGAIALHLGTFVGSSAAAFGVVWMTLGKKLREDVRDVETRSVKTEDIDGLREKLGASEKECQERFGRLEGRASVLETKVTTQESQVKENASRVDRIQERMGSFVTDEEFQTDKNHTAQSLSSLTEKIGRAVGALEAWRRPRDT